MIRRHSLGHSATAIVTAIALVAPASGVGLMQTPAPAPATAKPATPAAKATPVKTAATPPPAPAPTTDLGWPRSYTTPSGAHAVMYAPQIASWEGQKRLVAYAAVSYQAKGAEKPELGTLTFETATTVSVSERLVKYSQLKITEAKLGKLDRDQSRELVAEIDAAIPDQERVIALDRVLANVDKSQIMPKNVEGVKADPPTIFFSTRPAVLVNIDGDPIWSPIKDNDLKFAVNTNWDLFEHAPTKHVLPAQRRHLAEGDRREGPVDAGGPAAGELHEAAGRRELEGRQGGASRARSSTPRRRPTVFVSTDAGRADPADAASRATCWSRARALLWVQQHRQRRVPRRQDRADLLPRGRAAGSRRRTSRDRGRSRRRRCRRTSRRSRSSTRDRACSRRCPARRRPPKRCCSRRSRRPRA